MTKAMRELLQSIEANKAKVRALIGENDLAAAEKLMEEVRAAQRQADLLRELDEDDDDVDIPVDVPKAADKDLEKEYEGIFLRGLRRQKISAADRSIISEYKQSIYAAVMHEGGANPTIPLGDSSLIVPVDSQTRINTLMREFRDLSGFITVETTNTLSGTRVLEADTTMTPLQPVVEYGQIQETDNPTFVPVAYQLVKRAGYLPLTSELLADSDQNILAYVEKWLAKKSVVTRNTLITTLIAGLAPVPLADMTAIKNALNVTLDPAIAANAAILTNQDGYHWMDQQVDGNGRYLLQDDITQPGRKLFKGLPVYVVSNRYLASAPAPNATAPLVIGDGKQLAILFTAGRLELASTKEGGDAWRRDTTELRVISRDDCVLWDAAAAVHGRLAL